MYARRLGDLSRYPPKPGCRKMTRHRLRNRLTRFRLRTLLALIAVSSVALAWFAWNLDLRRQEKPAIAEVEKQGGMVIYHSFFEAKRSWLEKQGDNWFGDSVHTVDLRNSDAADLTHLSKLRKLNCVALSFSRVSDVTPLAELVNIDEIYLEGTDVEDLSSLKKLAKLQMLWLDSTPVKDLSPLYGLQDLRRVNLRDTELTEHEVEELRNALLDCKIVYSRRETTDTN